MLCLQETKCPDELFPHEGIAALGFFVAFVLWERRAPEPIIGLHLFRERVYVSGVVASAMLVFAMMGTTVFLPLYFQLVLGMTPTQATSVGAPANSGPGVAVGWVCTDRRAETRPRMVRRKALETRISSS